MKLQAVTDRVASIPYMSPTQGAILYYFIRTIRPQRCLELGFYHGVSSCYIAAGLFDNRAGRLMTLDFAKAKNLSPNLCNLLADLNLDTFVTSIFSRTDYNWELMKIIEQQTAGDVCIPLFDFCFIDGSHLWNIDGLAFFLVEKLLKPGGWILFDDVDWTIENNYSVAPQDEYFQSLLTEHERRQAPQVKKIVELLVRQHPAIEFVEERSDMTGWTWGWARKISTITEARETTSLQQVLDTAYDAARMHLA